MKKRYVLTLFLVAFISENKCFGKSSEQPPELSLLCEAKSVYFSYADNSFYIKDLHSHAKELYSERFIIHFFPSGRATKKHANDMVEDEDYSVIKTGSVYNLKSIKGVDAVSAVIDLKNGKYSAVSEKHDALIRIKATGACEIAK